MLTGLSPVLAFLAGVLTFLSPCVLPLVPIVFASAQSTHRLGPMALGAGLALSFTMIGLFAATIGYSLGLDADVFRTVGAILLLGFAGVLSVPALQRRFELVAAPAGNFAQRLIPVGIGNGLSRQFLIGTLLGIVWLPCVGPTLGAALLLASQGGNLTEVAIVMLAFAIGAAVPLTLIGVLSAKALAGRRGGMAMVGIRGRLILGAVLAIVAVMILTNTDRRIETALTTASPDWLVSLTTRY